MSGGRASRPEAYCSTVLLNHHNIYPACHRNRASFCRAFELRVGLQLLQITKTVTSVQTKDHFSHIINVMSQTATKAVASVQMVTDTVSTGGSYYTSLPCLTVAATRRPRRTAARRLPRRTAATRRPRPTAATPRRPARPSLRRTLRLPAPRPRLTAAARTAARPTAVARTAARLTSGKCPLPPTQTAPLTLSPIARASTASERPGSRLSS
jgi:hypothetical protein